MPIFVSGNENKAHEFSEILGIKLEMRKIELDEIQSIDVMMVTEHKLLEAYNKVKQPVIIEDTGLHIGFINEFPGALVKHYFKCMKSEGIAMAHGTSPATAVTVIGYHNGSQMYFFEGAVKGNIASHARGENGFGWDNIFIPTGYDKTFAQMTAEEKNACSMRKIALVKFMQVINPQKYKELQETTFRTTYLNNIHD